MNRQGFKAVILDMDGVITRTADLHARAWKRMFDEYLNLRGKREGVAYEPFDSDGDYRRYVDGVPRYDGVCSFLAARGIEIPLGEETDGPDRETICGLGNRKNQIFHEMLERGGVEAFDDAVEQIGNWKRKGLEVAVISSSRNCEAVLEAAGLLDLFDAKVDGNDLSRHGLEGKPAPDVFLRAAADLGVRPVEAIVVEDAIAGVRAGRAGRFGMVVGVARDPGAAADLRRAGADRVVGDLREIEKADSGSPGEDGLPAPALENSGRILNLLQGAEPALFLDYDGTLTPIVRRPEDATLGGEMRSLLSKLSERCTVAIVSGRDRRNVKDMVGVESLIYAGSHGFDISGPGGLEMRQEEARRALPALDEAERKLRDRIDSIDGARLERKEFAIAVHYREVKREEGAQRIEEAVDAVLGEHPGLRKRGGKKIFELQPDVEWDKGRAVRWLAGKLGLDHPGVVVIYIGDDATDEDAFRELRRRGGGIGIRVGGLASDTRAAYYLRDCGEVRKFLQSLLGILEANSGSRT